MALIPIKKGKPIIRTFSCKKDMKFSGDYVDLVENIIILITVALWEICSENIIVHVLYIEIDCMQK